MECIYVAKRGTSSGPIYLFIYLFMVYLTKLSVAKFIAVHDRTIAVVSKLF